MFNTFPGSFNRSQFYGYFWSYYRSSSSKTFILWKPQPTRSSHTNTYKSIFSLAPFNTKLKPVGILNIQVKYNLLKHSFMSFIFLILNCRFFEIFSPTLIFNWSPMPPVLINILLLLVSLIAIVILKKICRERKSLKALIQVLQEKKNKK